MDDDDDRLPWSVWWRRQLDDAEPLKYRLAEIYLINGEAEREAAIALGHQVYDEQRARDEQAAAYREPMTTMTFPWRY
jgi:hypothetical protein